MDSNDAQSKLMDYLYDEMEPEERHKFEEILRSNPDLQQELDEMQLTRKLLSEDTGEITPGNLMLIKTGSDSSSGKDDRTAASEKVTGLKLFTGVAAAILLAFALFSFANLQITHSDRGTLISFGDVPPSQPVDEPASTEAFITETEFYGMMSELQEQNNRVTAAALEQTREQHQQQLENVIETLTAYYDRRRQQDLVLVSEGLAQLEEETYYRFLQTEEALEDLIFALNVQQTNE